MSDETSAAIAELQRDVEWGEANPTLSQDVVMGREVARLIYERLTGQHDATIRLTQGDVYSLTGQIRRERAWAYLQGRAAASSDAQAYEVVRDAVMQHLAAFVQDGEAAEESLLVDAVKRAAAAASSDLDAIKREAATKAWHCALGWAGVAYKTPDCQAALKSHLDREYSAPVPEPPHVMVNGWRVTWDGEQYVAKKSGENDFSSPSAVALCRWCAVFAEADTDVVRVLALREGRGDQ